MPARDAQGRFVAGSGSSKSSSGGGSGDIRIVLNPEGVRALLQSAEVQADLESRAHRIAATAGDGMEVETGIGRSRARATVRTGTEDARVAEATDRSLTNAIDAGRG